MQIYGGIFAMQRYWNHTSAWVTSSKFSAFWQNNFSEEHLWRAAPGHLHYKKKHTVSCFLSLSTVIIHQFHSYTKIVTYIPFIPTASSPHSHPDFHHFYHESPHSHPYSQHSHPDSPHSHPYSLYSHPDSPHSHPIPCIPTLIFRIPHISTLNPRIPIIPFIPFPDFLFRLLQIAFEFAVTTITTTKKVV